MSELNSEIKLRPELRVFAGAVEKRLRERPDSRIYLGYIKNAVEDLEHAVVQEDEEATIDAAVSLAAYAMLIYDAARSG